MRYLLEHASRTVSKEELIAAIWNQEAVTDNSLTQCIAEIRKAFGDDSRHPTYIRSVPKVGYEFIASVETIPAPESIHEASEPVFLIHPEEESVPQPVRQQPKFDLLVLPDSKENRGTAGTKADKPHLSGRDQLKLAVLLAAVLACIWGIPYIYKVVTNPASGVPPLPAKHSLAILYFVNESGNRTDNWLRHGLTDMMITDMAQSGGLHVLDRTDLATLVKEQRRDHLTPDPARSIALAAHAADYLTGSFAYTPSQVRIDIQLHNTRSGQIIYADHSIRTNPANVLSQVDALSARLAKAMSLQLRSGNSTSAVGNSNTRQYHSPETEKAG